MRIGLRELVFFIVLLAVPVASFIWVFKPRNAEITQARVEIEAKQTKLNTLAKVASKIDDIGLEIEKGQESVQMIEAKLPNEQDVEGILEQVWQIAKRNKLVVKSVKSDKPVPAALYMELPLKMEMTGEFDGFYEFLLELENLPRITRLHQLKLERVDAKAEARMTKEEAQEVPPGGMKAEFTLSIYFQPQGSNPTIRPPSPPAK